MKKRSAEILRRLIESPSHRLRLSALMDDYRISEKTLRADIAAAAAFAQDPRGNSMVEVSSEHVRLAMGSDVAGLDELLDSMDLYAIAFRLTSVSILLHAPCSPFLTALFARCKAWRTPCT